MCLKRKRFFIFPGKHTYLFTNVATSLDSPSSCELIKTCEACGHKEVTVVDVETIGECIEKYPHAFSDKLREYLNGRS